MSNKEKMLEKYRQEIDEVDNQMLKLLAKRVQIVQRVGSLKESMNIKKSIIRPGREAIMVRDIINKSDVPMPKAAIGQIWRTIIAGAINIEENSRVAVFDTQNNRECFWLAREYFGMFTPMSSFSNIPQAVEDVALGNSTIAVVPLWGGIEISPWWAQSQESQSLKVFARLPFLRNDDSRLIPIVAVGNVVPEDSGDDNSLWVFKTKKNISLDVIEPWLVKAGFTCNLQATKQGEQSYYLIELEGFVTKDNPQIKQAIENMGRQVISANYLGSYATAISCNKMD